jgi:hypothetical protein
VRRPRTNGRASRSRTLSPPPPCCPDDWSGRWPGLGRMSGGSPAGDESPRATSRSVSPSRRSVAVPAARSPAADVVSGARRSGDEAPGCPERQPGPRA